MQPQQACNLSASTASLAFGDVNVGSSSTLDTTLSNSGNWACNVTLQRTGSADFAIVGGTSFNVNAGATRTVSVSYTPGSVGPDSGTLVATSNDPSSPTNVALSGTGVDQTATCNQVPTPPSTPPARTVSDGNCLAAVPGTQHQLQRPGDQRPRHALRRSGHPHLQHPAAVPGTARPGNPEGFDEPDAEPRRYRSDYSAALQSERPVANVFDGIMGNGDTYKTNFWDFPVPAGTYDPFYPAYDPFNPAQSLTPLDGPPFNVSRVGLPVPNVEDLYIGPDGNVHSGDESLTAVLHAMPGMAGPYTVNNPQLVRGALLDKPFFVNFPFGYVAADVNWFEGAASRLPPLTTSGARTPIRWSGWRPGMPAVRRCRQSDTVLPISGEASCMNCHSTSTDYASVYGDTTNHQTNGPTDVLTTNGLPVATTADDPSLGDLPPRVSLEYAADINVLRLHDFRHGGQYVSTACDAPGQNCLNTAAAPCDIAANGGIGDANCLTNQALPAAAAARASRWSARCATTRRRSTSRSWVRWPVLKARCQRSQSARPSEQLARDAQPPRLAAGQSVPADTAAEPERAGVVTNQATRLAAMEESCYQCHPGTSVQCLRGAMFNGDMLCSDCHGSMPRWARTSPQVSRREPGRFPTHPGQLLRPEQPPTAGALGQRAGLRLLPHG